MTVAAYYSGLATKKKRVEQLTLLHKYYYTLHYTAAQRPPSFFFPTSAAIAPQKSESNSIFTTVEQKLEENQEKSQSAFTFTRSLFTSLLHVFRQLLTVEVKAQSSK